MTDSSTRQKDLEEPGKSMRTVPQQARGHQRVKTILDTAEALFAEVGYENATTNQIAQRAHTSIGSLYQFFPNKEAILHSLAERYRCELREMYMQRIIDTDLPQRPLPEVIDRLIDAFHQFLCLRRSYFSIMLQAQTASELNSSIKELYEAGVRRLEEILVIHRKDLSAEQRKLKATVALKATNALFSLALQQDNAEEHSLAKQTIAEIKVFLLAYFTAL
ncbi:MAG TPA: TetR/AcrR family transcriptional regulator [Chloroflexia bacterium]|nr:TetR/AcrR family transcriptional regulator [Chloroflexia bacterium]